MFRLSSTSKLVFLLYCLFMISVSPFIFAEVEKDLLDMTLEELMNVKITTAGRIPEKIGDIPASVVLITREDIEKYGYKTLAEILENIPGLYPINDYSAGGTNFGVRGFWSGVPNDNMIILINGVPQIDDFQSNYPLDKISIPVEAIERIEVIRGPMSVIYGNGAFYGVINIFTNNFSRDGAIGKNEEKPVNIFSSSLGSEQTKKIFVKTSGEKNRLKYVLNASLYDTYGIDQPLNKMVSNLSDLPKFYGVPENQRTGGRLERNEKYFNFSGAFNGFFIDIGYNETNSEFYYLMPSYSIGNSDINRSTNISIGYKKKFSDKVTLDGRFNYFQNRVWEVFDFLSEDFYGIQQYESNCWEIDLNTFITASHTFDLKTGLFFRSILNANTMYDLPSFGTPTLENNYLYLNGDDDIITQAIYTQLNYRPFPNFSIVTGLRLERMPKYGLGAILAGGTEYFKKIENVYDQDEIEIIPRLAAIYTVNDKHFFKLLYGHAINRPSFFQNTLNLLLEPSKGSLKPESIQTLELNYIASLSSDFTLNFSIFRNILENLITRVGELDENKDYQTWSANAGKMITNGTELTLNLEPIKNFRIELSGIYQNTKDKRKGYENIKVPYSPKLLGYMKATYHSTGFSIALTGNFVSDMETYWDESIINVDGSKGKRIGDVVESYFLLGANIRVEKFFVKGLYLDLRCSSLLNEEVRYPTFTNNAWATRGTIGSGRTFLLSLGIKF